MAPVVERGVERTRRDMVPYLAVAAFAGLRAAEIKPLDWSEVHLAGDEKFIEVKASKSKTASRRLVPIVPSLAVWLMPFAQSSGPLVPVERVDKQLFERLARRPGFLGSEMPSGTVSSRTGSRSSRTPARSVSKPAIRHRWSSDTTASS